MTDFDRLIRSLTDALPALCPGCRSTVGLIAMRAQTDHGQAQVKSAGLRFIRELKKRRK